MVVSVDHFPAGVVLRTAERVGQKRPLLGALNINVRRIGGAADSAIRKNLAIKQVHGHIDGCLVAYSLVESLFPCIAYVSSSQRRCDFGRRAGWLNVSVAETAHQDSWQRAEIACAAVASDKRVLDQTLRAADQLVEQADGVRIMDATADYR